MKTTYTGNNSQFSRQHGFFTIGVGLGLSALFALFGTVLEPEQQVSGVNEPVAVQEMVTNSQSVLVVSYANSGQHQF